MPVASQYCHNRADNYKEVQDKSTLRILVLLSVIAAPFCNGVNSSRNPGFPVKTGIRFHIFLVPCPPPYQVRDWIPVPRLIPSRTSFTGMTTRMIYFSDAHGRPHLNSVKDMSSRVGRAFRKVFPSPQGEGFPPSPMGKLTPWRPYPFLIIFYRAKQTEIGCPAVSWGQPESFQYLLRRNCGYPRF